MKPEAQPGDGRYEAHPPDVEALRQYRIWRDRVDHRDRAQARLADSWAYLGLSHTFAGRHEDACACYEEAIAADPNHAMAHLFYGVALLRLGDLARGWEEYEWRWWTLGDTLPPGIVQDDRPGRWGARYPRPAWSPADFSGRSVVLHGEAGFGDQIQFVRYARLVSRCGAEVCVICPPALVRLFEGSPRHRPRGTDDGRSPAEPAGIPADQPSARLRNTSGFDSQRDPLPDPPARPHRRGP